MGRYKHRAFAICLTIRQVINTKAQERLKNIEDFTTLGSGLQVALKDLEIRGQVIFRPEQSGHINAVGFDTYRELIEEAIAEIKGNPSSAKNCLV